ncbi:hypothetical protein [Sulfuriflexus mobilis]|uniref:hypothetical protein n=1 Tax=Sulfuriflexus mobilis TaxID=1811807 RepID=UPI0018D55932|nr:hypothetical protein [Sulfuriflexus mobilis]
MRSLVLLAVFIMPVMSLASEGTWSGNVALEWRDFLQSPLAGEQQGDSMSLSFQPEYYRQWNNGQQAFRFTPFVRIDGKDQERSHLDLRELSWTYVSEEWELLAGVSKVYWGVAESLHLVDIINQTDLVENPDGEEKLGQPMIKLTLVRDWGDLDLFILPGFRERTFPGRRGRLRTQVPASNGDADYASSAGREHIDVAARWRKTLGDWDIGLSHFSGTARQPLFREGTNSAGRSVLIPVYDTIDQTGLDVQATKGDWLWKLEAISRSGQGERFSAAVGGFEYTLYGIFDSGADLGLLTEYLYDERGNAATTPFEDDVFIGARLAMNDVASSELLAGVITDLSNGSQAYNLEASRRFGQHWKLNLEARLFSNINAKDLLAAQRNDDYVQLELAYYF